MLSQVLVRSLALAALSAGAALAAPVLSPNAAWLMDASMPPETPKGDAWVDPLPSPINLALRDLQRDWTKVFGMPASVVAALPTKQWDGDVVVVFALAAPGAAAPESFTVVAAPAGGASSAPTLTITGADARGLIYGIYHVSADFLGVDAFWWFNDVAPLYEPAGVAVDPAYSYASGAPAFDSRGGFNNDEDLSGYFASSPLGDSVYNEFWADRMCEALLRLRVNTFIPSTFAFIDEKPYKVAAMRGLRLGNHHVMPLGNNVCKYHGPNPPSAFNNLHPPTHPSPRPASIATRTPLSLTRKPQQSPGRAACRTPTGSTRSPSSRPGPRSPTTSSASRAARWSTASATAA